MTYSSRRFLGPGDFVGSFRTPSSVPNIGAESTFQGALTFFNLPRSDVAQVVPGGIELAAKQASAPELHPVVLVFGRQDDLRWLLPGPNPPPLPSSYSELVLLIPFVQRRGAANWHSLAARMYLDDPVPLLLGNLHYGYAKELATLFGTSADGALIKFETRKATTRYFEADLRHAGDWRTHEEAQATLPNYRDMQMILSMPILGITARRNVCSYFQWDYSAISIRPMITHHQFLEPFVDGMGPWTKKPIDSATEGAIALRNLKWRIGRPFDCEFQ
jgi:hypothetical protein